MTGASRQRNAVAMVRGSCRCGTAGCGVVWLARAAFPEAEDRIGAPTHHDAAEWRPGWPYRQDRCTPFGSYPTSHARMNMLAMQVLASNRAKAGRPSRIGVATSLLVGAALVAASAVLLYLVFGDHFVDRFMPRGHATTYELI